jgi:hypothetical protein
MNESPSSKPFICIYANNEKNEFAIGFREDENFRAIVIALHIRPKYC